MTNATIVMPPSNVEMCKILGGKLRFYGEPKVAEQVMALRQMFGLSNGEKRTFMEHVKFVLAKTPTISPLNLTIRTRDGSPVPVYLLVAKNLDPNRYAEFLEEHAKGMSSAENSFSFGLAVDHVVTGEKSPLLDPTYNIWFDYTASGDQRNAVFWTLNEGKRNELRVVLGGVRRFFIADRPNFGM